MQTDPMRLGALSLAELTALNGTMTALAAAGQMLMKAGLTPTFDLTPRLPMRLQVDVVMPVDAIGETFQRWLADDDPTDIPAAEQTGAPSPDSRDGAAGAAGESRDGGGLADPAPIAVTAIPTASAIQATSSRSGDVDAPAVGPTAGATMLPVVSPDTTGDGVDSVVAAPMAAAIEVPEPLTWGDSGAQEVPAVAMSTAAAPPAAVTSQPAGVKGLSSRWTEAEDVRALALYLAALREGALNDAALLVVAKALDRSFGGVGYRFKTVLKDRVDVLTRAVAKDRAAAAKAPAPAPQTAPPPQPVRSEIKAPVAPLPSDIAGHLATVPLGRGWKREWDVGLMEMACDGFDMASIAVDLGTDAGSVKARFDALTGVYKDANDKACRLFTREQVRDQLKKTTPLAAD